MQAILKYIRQPKPYLKNTQTGFLDPASITLATKKELAKIYKKDGWNFKWSIVPSDEVQVFKICLDESPLLIQGLNSNK